MCLYKIVLIISCFVLLGNSHEFSNNDIVNFRSDSLGCQGQRTTLAKKLVALIKNYKLKDSIVNIIGKPNLILQYPDSIKKIQYIYYINSNCFIIGDTLDYEKVLSIELDFNLNNDSLEEFRWGVH
jgi:hypothetical protein